MPGRFYDTEQISCNHTILCFSAEDIVIPMSTMTKQHNNYDPCQNCGTIKTLCTWKCSKPPLFDQTCSVFFFSSKKFKYFHTCETDISELFVASLTANIFLIMASEMK